MLIEITKDELLEWKQNLTDTAEDPILTTTAVIKLEDLEEFIREMKLKKANCANINLVRFTWNKDEPQRRTNPDTICKWLYDEDSGKTQVAMIITPATYAETTDPLVGVGNDIISNGHVRVLIPGNEDKGPTGHNPPGKGG